MNSAHATVFATVDGRDWTRRAELPVTGNLLVRTTDDHAALIGASTISTTSMVWTTVDGGHTWRVADLSIDLPGEPLLTRFTQGVVRGDTLRVPGSRDGRGFVLTWDWEHDSWTTTYPEPVGLAPVLDAGGDVIARADSLPELPIVWASALVGSTFYQGSGQCQPDPASPKGNRCDQITTVLRTTDGGRTWLLVDTTGIR
jgi:photosystem II stability/assembly factor-like uncharacterized protein